MNISNIKNILFYTSISLGSVLCFAYFFSIPLFGDDWLYSVKPLQEIYTLKPGLHPGRNISEFIHIFSDQILGNFLGTLFNNYLTAIKLVHAFVSTFIILGLCWTSSLYINSQSKKIFIILFLLLSTMLSRAFSEFTITSQIYGGLFCSLLLWSPFAYFFQQGRLPRWFEENTDRSYGVWLALCYIGTQVHDNSNFLIAFMSILTLNFLRIHTFEYKYKPFLKKLLVTQIIFSMFTLLRNTVLTNQISYRKQGIRTSVLIILERIINTNLFVNISLLLGVIAFIFLLHRLLKTKKLERIDLFNFILLSASFMTIVFLAALGTHSDQGVWILWISLINIMLYSFKKYAFYTIPTLMLGLIISLPNTFNVRKFFLPNGTRTTRFEFIKSRVDYKLIEALQTAEKENKKEILFDGRFIGWNSTISEWMYHYNYTSSRISIISEPNND